MSTNGARVLVLVALLVAMGSLVAVLVTDGGDTTVKHCVRVYDVWACSKSPVDIEESK